MKKLMIAAAAAAMIGGAQAVTCVKTACDSGAGTAHKVAISLKTTAPKAKKTKIKDDCDKCNVTYSCVNWREQTTKKINGLIWEKLADCDGCVPFGSLSAFWTKEGALDVEFSIGIGLIGKGKYNKAGDYYESNKIEAYGFLGDDNDDFGNLAWAGFGSLTGNDGGKCGNCVMYVKSITGGIAGQLIPYEDPDCNDPAYDGCCGDMQLGNTAAYGTIKITYDKSTAKKVALAVDDMDINEFYKLPAAAALDYELDVVEPADVIIEE